MIGCPFLSTSLPVTVTSRSSRMFAVNEVAEPKLIGVASSKVYFPSNHLSPQLSSHAADWAQRACSRIGPGVVTVKE